MTQATDITIKKNDGTTDITWTLLTASGGDKSPAIWRSDSASGTPGQHPVVQIQARNNGAVSARRLDITFVYPSVYTDSTTGQTKVSNKTIWNLSGVNPTDVPISDANEAAAQLANLLKHAQFQAMLKSGYANT